MTRILIVEDLAEARAWLSGIAKAAFAAPHEIEAVAIRKAGLTAAVAHDYDVARVELSLPDGTG
ncbi:MAG: DNA-binding response regulator, partial [Martelella sp.]